MKIWSLGDAVVDLLPLENNQYQACAGGAPVNVAIGIRRLGVKSAFIGRVGQDHFGEFMWQTLQDHQVDTQYMEFDSQYATSTVLVSLSEQGERHFTFLVNPSADQFLIGQQLATAEANLLHFCSLSLVGVTCRNTLDQTISRIRQKKGEISFDINLRLTMWRDQQQARAEISAYAKRVDILKIADDELLWLTEQSNYPQALIMLQQHYPAKLKMITFGDKGSIALWQGAIYFMPAYQVISIDTTGAGDAFVAGMLTTYLVQSGVQSTEQLARLMQHAAACGALATTQKGAITAAPTEAELKDFLKRQPPQQLDRIELEQLDNLF